MVQLSEQQFLFGHVHPPSGKGNVTTLDKRRKTTQMLCLVVADSRFALGRTMLFHRQPQAWVRRVTVGEQAECARHHEVRSPTPKGCSLLGQVGPSRGHAVQMQRLEFGDDFTHGQ